MQLQAGDRQVEVDLIVFDKDGTLVDLHTPWGSWAEGVAAALAEHLPPAETLRRLGWDMAEQRVAAETPLAIASAEDLRAVLAAWLYDVGVGWSAAMAAAVAATDQAQPHTARSLCPLLPLLDHLGSRGALLAVVTTDDHAGVVRDLAPLGVLGALSATITGDMGLRSKPAPDMLLAACTMAHVPPERTLVIGDSVADLMMGRAAGAALVVGVLSGGGTTADLTPHADVVLPNVCALAGLMGGAR